MRLVRFTEFSTGNDVWVRPKNVAFARPWGDAVEICLVNGKRVEVAEQLSYVVDLLADLP